MIVPAADAARAVAYSPEHRRDIISLYVSRNKGFSALCRPIIYAEGTALVSFFNIYKYTINVVSIYDLYIHVVKIES